jgi:hypothetical protein
MRTDLIGVSLRERGHLGRFAGWKPALLPHNGNPLPRIDTKSTNYPD